MAKLELAGTWNSANSTPGLLRHRLLVGGDQGEPAGDVLVLPQRRRQPQRRRVVDRGQQPGERGAVHRLRRVGHRGRQQNVNQRTSGSRWNTLGTWHFTKGWNKVVLSRWTSSGDVVIADAVRIR